MTVIFGSVIPMYSWPLCVWSKGYTSITPTVISREKPEHRAFSHAVMHGNTSRTGQVAKGFICLIGMASVMLTVYE
jgi:hypothetical protein